MSLRAITWAFDQHDTTPTQRLVLLAYADYCNSDGIAWPSIETLMQKTGFSKATIYRARSELCNAGKLEKLAERDHYRILRERKDVSERDADSQSENGTTYRNPHEPPSTAPPEAGERSGDDEPQELYDAYQRIVCGGEPKKITPSLRRVAEKALREFALPDLAGPALHGFVNWRKQKSGDRRFSSIFQSHPGGRPLHDHIAFWISQADPSQAARPATRGPRVLSEADVKINRAVRDVQRAFGSNDPDTLATGEEALAYLKSKGIEPVPRDSDGYPTFPTLGGRA